MSVAAQPVEGQDPTAAAPAPAAPAAEPVANDGPWASDLALLGLDAESLTKVNTFLGAKVQPYATKLEQELAAARPATTLFNDLTNPEKSVEAFVAVTYEMFGQEAGDKVIESLQGQTPEQQQATVAAAVAPAEGTAQYAKLDPETQAFLDEQRMESATRSYDKDMAAIIAANPDIPEAKLHIWVAQADGDFNQAVQLYRAYMADVIPAPPDPTAPAVLGSDTGGGAASTTPVEPKKQTMQQAVDRTMAMLAKQDAPAVLG
jgi:hypothetical protein